MEYAICLLSIAPLRAAPDDKSEMVTQMLFGDMALVLQMQEKWALVQLDADKYQGWVALGQLSFLQKEEYEELNTQKQWVSNDLIQLLENKTLGFSFFVSAGSIFRNCTDHTFQLLGHEYYYHGKINLSEKYSSDVLLDHAMIFLHTPYLWGGKSALGMDCSGFTQLVFKMAGKPIHRDASQQATQGEVINLIHEAKPGDLLFFDNEEGEIIHTGILFDSDTIIHAHHKVRLDKIDHHGIFNVDTRKYTHQLRLIKRMS